MDSWQKLVDFFKKRNDKILKNIWQNDGGTSYKITGTWGEDLALYYEVSLNTILQMYEKD